MREIDEITREIVDATFQLHSRLGPGLLESVYETLLASSLERRGLSAQRQVPVSFEFDGIRLQDGFRVDLLVEGQIVLELKSMEKVTPIHAKQLLTYLRLMDLRVGLLINFGAPTFKEGLRRIVNRHQPTAYGGLRLNQDPR
jgi:GxxExxY protein